MSKTMYAVAILLCAQAAHADVLFFVSQAEFQGALEQAGRIKKGIESFPWLALPGSVTNLGDPLDINSSLPGWVKPGDIIDNLTFQSNLTPFGSNGTNPRGFAGLALFTQGFIGATQDGVVAGHFVDSFDILSGPPDGDNHTAMALQLISFNNSPAGSAVTVSVYDKDDDLIGSASDISAPANQGGTFLGILSTGGDTLGRVNIYDVNVGFAAQGIYSIAVYVPAPGSVFLLGLAGLVGTRRRRE